jgi:hypothetical protein
MKSGVSRIAAKTLANLLKIVTKLSQRIVRYGIFSSEFVARLFCDTRELKW